MKELSNVSNDDLIESLGRLTGSQRSVMAELVFHLAEVDARRLYADKGFPSLFSYCVEGLRFSEDEACRRIDAARLGRRFPLIYELLKTSAVTLTVVGLLKHHVTHDNHLELFAGVSNLSVRDAKEWLAARFPQADVPWSIRKHPSHPRPARVTLHHSPHSPAAALATPPATTLATRDPAELASSAAPVTQEHPATGLRGSHAARVEPLSLDRFLVKLTVSRAIRDKLELARDLMSHRNPSGDLAVVIERAVDLLVEELEKVRLGRTGKPERRRRPAKPAHVANGTRREVVARDGLGCSFVASDGRRCGARAFLEFDHERPKGRGGASGRDNVRLLCRAHNFLCAERIYGTAHMQRAVSKAREEYKEGPAASAHWDVSNLEPSRDEGQLNALDFSSVAIRSPNRDRPFS